jgi:(S)-2-hydroxyglutarate dehydrogenase
MRQTYDYLVIGGGIVGASTAMQLGQAYPDARIGLIEKEPNLAAHQTGHNSGVIHAGVYYAPGSMKARFCRAGVDATVAFSRAHNIPVEQCGKMIVATDDNELGRMADLHDRATQNGLQITRLGADELSEREPNVRGVGALFVSVTGIANYPAITVAMGREVVAQGGDLHLGQTVRTITERADSVTVETDAGTYQTRQLVVCGGLQADRLARMAGLEADFAIVPFRGEYFRLAPRHDDIVRSLIYPVPDPSVPFLGVHLTRMIGGYVTVGPNAVLGLAREGYAKTDVSLRDMAAMAGYAGFWRVMAKNLGHGVGEMRNSLSRRRYLKLCQRYAPGLELDDLQLYPAGIRAQAVARDGTLVHDFLMKRTARMLHVCNAPSPAATSALPIGAHIVETLAS